ncbi:hypothetical protein QVD17_01819 [Tagetes erecta]|uniref:Late embryogenesis abundant protein LEA-2 subgroup domain-containing protein n=1 Tax=Tagetes erecta TaxID=13708 RepID=A0AAD8L869_TARER|nr:hypothetical protein QVD17_01819 [Tagetes erecta]
MTDRVHPSSKPNTNTLTIKNPKLPLPPAKLQIHNQNNRRYPTKFHHKRRHNSRRCFCLCCFWSILIIILILILATVSGTVLYLLYRPHRPSFSIASLKISQFNLTTAIDGTTQLTSKLNLTISAKNPNSKIIFHYDPIAISCLTDETEIANGLFGTSFVSDPNNITIIRSSLSSNALLLETEAVKRIRSDLKRRAGLMLKVLLDTQTIVKFESFRSKKFGIRIECVGIRSVILKTGGRKSNSSSSSSVTVSVDDAKCEVDFRIKIWKWSF